MPAVKNNSDSSAAAQNGNPILHYWHIWTDERGTSHQTRCALTSFARQSIGGAAAQWNDRQAVSTSGLLFTVLPVGWVGEWHENPRPQWILPLSGRWFVESMDATRCEMGAGDLSFGGDQGCIMDLQGRKGHRSGTLGDRPAVLMIVQLDAATALNRPCCFK